MSQNARRFTDRKLCSCGRPALTKVRGRAPKYLADHELCLACFRDLLNATRNHRRARLTSTPKA